MPRPGHERHGHRARPGPLAVAIWAYDRTGNVGPPAELQISP